MISITRTDSSNSDFTELVKLLDADLAIRDGDEHTFYAQFNKTAYLKEVVVAYINGKAAGCGALKPFEESTAEVKRMFVLPEYRGKGIASAILSALETWSGEIGCKKCVLETGRKQPEAIALYKKNGYHIISNYGQYAGKENSICFEKEL